MKAPTALVTLLLPLLLLTSCSPPKEIDYSKLKYSNDVFTDPATKAPFTGIARQKYPDGKQRAEYPFKNGRFDGTVKEWHPNGKPSAETAFKNGERSGKNIEWTADGKPFRERVYDHDHIVSEKNYDAAK
jgi:antitoxin component YwqK of YwqJK toxin-antitoxin module